MPVEFDSCLVRMGRSLNSCGKVSMVQVCEHDKGEGGHDVNLTFQHCDNWFCPECSKKVSSRASNKIADRLTCLVGEYNQAITQARNVPDKCFSPWAVRHGLHKVHSLKTRHVILSISPKEKHSVKSARRKFKEIIKDYCVAPGYVMVIHLYRLDNFASEQYIRSKKAGLVAPGVGKWEWAWSMGQDFVKEHRVYGAHAHLVGVGKWQNSRDINKKTGVVVCGVEPGKEKEDKKDKEIEETGTYNLGSPSGVFNLVNYLLSHACININDVSGRRNMGKAYSWVGVFSSLFTKVVEEKTEELVKCRCGGQLYDYHPNILKVQSVKEEDDISPDMINYDELEYRRLMLDGMSFEGQEKSMSRRIIVNRSWVLTVDVLQDSSTKNGSCPIRPEKFTLLLRQSNTTTILEHSIEKMVKLKAWPGTNSVVMYIPLTAMARPRHFLSWRSLNV